MDDKFKVVDENNLEHNAEVITAFTYKDKDYLVYSVDSDEENSNILVSRLVKKRRQNVKNANQNQHQLFHFLFTHGFDHFINKTTQNQDTDISRHKPVLSGSQGQNMKL